MKIIELKNITKQYPGSKKKANNNISLDLRKGEILCIAGENGAGKTTLMKILYGLEKQDSGDIFFNGKKIEINSVFDAKKTGIGMVHQHFMLFPEYTAAENIVMGNEPKKYGIFFDSKKAEIIADKIIEENNFSIKSGLKVKDLTLGEMQQVEICRILHQNSQIIIMDEPTSILTDHEIKSLFAALKKLAGLGKSIIIITHKIHEIKQIADRVAALRRGELVGIRDISGIDEKKIACMMIGDGNNELKQKVINEEKKESKPVIEFKNVTVKKRDQKRLLLDNVSFSVSPGEILGFAGVGGNGLGVIEAVLGGFLHPESGKIFHNGKDITPLDTRALRKEGLAYVPADRTRVGSAPDATIEENMIINSRIGFFTANLRESARTKEKYQNTGSCFIRGSRLTNKEKQLELNENLIERYNIDAANRNEKASTLSGGNLQKLILAREINCLKDYIVFSEPTWGLDIASSDFILKEIDLLRKKGAAVIIISTNLDELLEAADRIIVMYRGKAAGIFSSADEAAGEKIGNCMQGLSN